MKESSRAKPPCRDLELRRAALNLVTMLPEDLGEASQVLSYAQEVIDEFLLKPSPERDALRPGPNIQVVR